MTVRHVIYTDGRIERYEKPGAPDLDELRENIDCRYVERIRIANRDLWFDEEGKLKEHTPNLVASRLAHQFGSLFPGDYIAGNAVLSGMTANIERALEGLEVQDRT